MPVAQGSHQTVYPLCHPLYFLGDDGAGDSDGQYDFTVQCTRGIDGLSICRAVEHLRTCHEYNVAFGCSPTFSTRDIVLFYPQLWSQIVLHYRVNHRYRTKNLLDIRDGIPSALQVMILRSVQARLDILFQLNDEDKVFPPSQVFPALLKESCRWRNMYLQVSLTQLKQLKAVRGKIPCLQSFVMETFDEPFLGREDLPEDIRSVFVEAPRLRKVALHRLGDFTIPLHITHLATHMDKLSSVEAYKSLVECHLFTKDPPGQDFVPPHSVHFPHLRRLLVSPLRILAHLRLPSSDNLMIGDSNMSDDLTGLVSVMTEFVHCSRYTLTSLTIQHDITSYQPFINDCLSLLDNLVSLDVSLWNGEPGTLLNTLISPKFLPKLQHLSLRISSKDSLWDPLGNLLRARSNCLHTAEILCFGFDDLGSRRLFPWSTAYTV